MLSVVFESDGNDLMGIGILGVVGLCFAIYGINQLRKRRRLLKHGVLAKGIIESIMEEQGEDGPFYYPVIKFWTGKDWIADGHKKSSIANNYYVGDEVEIRFDRNDPRNFMIDDPGFLDGPSIITMIGCAILVCDIIWVFSKLS